MRPTFLRRQIGVMGSVGLFIGSALFVGSALFISSALFIGSAWAGEEADYVEEAHAGRASVYRQVSQDQVERVVTSDRIKAVARGNFAPTEIWRTLEHGEKVECLDCIPLVAELLYASHPKTREIGAWWLRRRVFGVFGPGEVYSQVVAVLNDRAQPELRRAHAAEALGEFLLSAGVRHVARAVTSDPSPLVRLSATRALERLGHQGPGEELAEALSDDSEEVRLAAAKAVTRINVFTRLEAVVARLGDSSPAVRRAAAEALGVMRASDAVAGLVRLASPDVEPEAEVRMAAVAALGALGDGQARPAVESALEDPDSFVRSAARIALRRL